MTPLRERNTTDHRPWPIPAGRHALHMSWHDLLFAHWPVTAGAMERHIPPGLKLDLFGGEAWLGVVPFTMSGVRPRMFPSVHPCSAFPELNVRTYVTDGRKPGVWFFSLDAASRVAVYTARRWYHLKYYLAKMRQTVSDGRVDYSSTRIHRGAPAAELHCLYAPTGDLFSSAPGSIEHWLTERYCLYACSPRGEVYRSEIHHTKWPLQPADANFEVNRMTEQIGVKLPETAPLLHFAKRLDVIAWKPERVS